MPEKAVVRQPRSGLKARPESVYFHRRDRCAVQNRQACRFCSSPAAPDLIGLNFSENRIYRINVFLHADIRRINHMQQQRRLTRLLQRRFKRGYQIVRQVANKADGIGQHRFADVRDVNAAQRRVEGVANSWFAA